MFVPLQKSIPTLEIDNYLCRSTCSTITIFDIIAFFNADWYSMKLTSFIHRYFIKSDSFSFGLIYKLE